MQVITISGNLGRDPELRNTQSGDSVCSFSVGVRNGFGNDAGTIWYRCSVWGKRGNTLSEHMRKGTRVFAIGTLTVGEYQGKPQYDVRVAEIDFVKAEGEARQSQGPKADSRGYVDPADLDDDVPF